MTAAKKEEYELLVEQAKALVAGKSDWIANTANLSALLFNSLNNVNFAGVYRFENGELILGPFQGMPACVHIQMGKGVCGTAAQTEKTQIVPNVHEFQGHIACDSASNSEIVVPIFKDDQLWGVFDFDSTKLDNFDETDKKYLTEIANVIFA
ncbi:GAF domain-containing protein [Lactobacillus helveticus]|uniref:GAF domain-containing protein n=1 Tax=Lactobacillus helveticus TaxID=1587 RepID=UPI001561F7F6|nr:GAF domain-containing protein [Lactobacillus helveticus]NRN88898.1 Free methionine-R-sulfoxide reductase [Lactobacillus helveticus]NRN93184.1 Free methionine-R-sulfoxide reductase [Lactobacillus helveticus]NRO44043.1 Free methionine-R-sulfoxide reductase [Lactobacillus helveticus]NRO53978.1 Free methionine-R-sulfoxide reductase [Lactobacillus helveticus]